MSIDFLNQFISKGACVIDAFNVLNDEKIIALKSYGFNIYGIGKGHIKCL